MTDWSALLVTGLVSGLVTGLAALAVTLVFGIARFANAATGDTMTLGAYVALSVATASGSLVLGGLAGVLAAALAGVAAYLLVFRRLAGRSSVTALLASIGVGFMVRAGIGLVYGFQQRVFPVPLVRPWRPYGVRITPLDLELTGLALCTLALVFLVLHATPVGRRMRAVADDPALAQVSGIDPARVMLTLWAMAGGVAGVAGLMVGVRTVVQPDTGLERAAAGRSPRPCWAGSARPPVRRAGRACCWAWRRRCRSPVRRLHLQAGGGVRRCCCWCCWCGRAGCSGGASGCGDA